jgi:hypothetical protein
MCDTPKLKRIPRGYVGSEGHTGTATILDGLSAEPSTPIIGLALRRSTRPET